jgi:uncharacterized membrane protein
MADFKFTGNTFEPRAGKLYESSNVLNVGKTERILSLATGLLFYSISAGRQNLLKRSLRYGGIYLLYRGVSGNCPAKAFLQNDKPKIHTPAVNIRTSFIIRAPGKIVYESWRNVEQLPRFFRHIKEITVTDDRHSHWVLKTPRNAPNVEWHAEIIDQEENRELSWRSLPGSKIETAGKINFTDSYSGTMVSVLISYRPPAGHIGSFVAGFINPSLKKMIEHDLSNFKRYIEAKAMARGYVANETSF